ncbi:Ubiquitin carboxyl-terminal hydrolase 36 [Frankliniella fusca]|uniref:Ubiquitin carboxyl-terminal hydrolase 36 n=1 Tax=Frankliniella fusca TaxID=407009 RepID=A0AAE1LTJ4_9NEOP|nr:Ubiquitin carboxyl-terminal hydrolase 36 [Frankliniella fusca]
MEVTSVCNTLLQVLVHAVVHWLSTSNHPANCKVNDSCLLCACCSVLLLLDMERVVKPENFFNIMKDACDDPQVVVEDIILRLHSDDMSLYPTVSVSIWSERTSPLFQIFGGLWKLSASCCSVTYKPFFTIKVPLNAQTIQLCLNSLKACDVCEVCNCPDMSIPTECSLHTALAVLILNLKRFSDDDSFCDKNVIIQPGITLLKQYLFCLRSVLFVNGTSTD